VHDGVLVFLPSLSESDDSARHVAVRDQIFGFSGLWLGEMGNP